MKKTVQSIFALSIALTVVAAVNAQESQSRLSSSDAIAASVLDGCLSSPRMSVSQCSLLSFIAADSAEMRITSNQSSDGLEHKEIEKCYLWPKKVCITNLCPVGLEPKKPCTLVRITVGGKEVYP